MRQKTIKKIPNPSEKIPDRSELMQPIFDALKKLGGSGKNEEILNQIIDDLKIPDEIANKLHKNSPNRTELSYQAAWARTYLRIYGIIENSARGVWSIKPDFRDKEKLDVESIIGTVRNQFASTHDEKKTKKQPKDKNPAPENDNLTDDDSEYPEELKPWREKLASILQNMNAYGFERLTQRLLRECGFTQVSVTKKSRDGGIDGTGKLQINGILSFNVAFQCKRYKEQVGAKEIRDFRGSLTTDIEKGIMITTGFFSKDAREEAIKPGKKQIDLIDGEEFISKIAEYEIGVKPVTIYEIDEEFFKKI